MTNSSSSGLIAINKLLKENWHYLVLFLLAVIGLLIRLKGFDKYGINAADEYYIIKSVKNILVSGLPEFASGGYYIRGILYQYLAAGLILLGVNDAAAVRIIPIICNILSIPAVYLIAKKVTTRSFGLFAVFLFAFSVWEVEISRLARFYAPFVLIFLWYIYLLLEVIIDKKLKNYKWLWLLSIIGVLVHEEGIFLIALNFLPYFLSKYKSKFIITILVLTAGVFLTLFDFRNLGVINHLPQDITFTKSSGLHLPIYIPKILIFQVISSSTWLAAFIVPFLAFTAYAYYFIRKPDTGLELKFYFLLIGIAGLLNLFGLAFFIILFLIFSKKLNPAGIQKPDIIRITGFLSISFFYYLLYCLTNPGWAHIFFNESFSLNKLGWILFNYPNIYEKFLMAWVQPFPLLTFIILISFAAIIFFYIKESLKYRNNPVEKKVKLNETIWNLILIVLILFFFVTIIVTPFKNLRYWYFIYPLLLVFVTYAVFRFNLLFKAKLLRNIIPCCLLILIFILSEDHNIKHLNNIDTLEISFRTKYPKKLAETYYFKEDYKSPAEIINQRIKTDDYVITTAAPIEYYLQRLDYYYRPYEDVEFNIRSRNSGKKEVWTNTNLFYKEDQLINFIERNNKNIWLITYSAKRPGWEFDKKLEEKYSDYLFYTNLDGSLNIFYITASVN